MSTPNTTKVTVYTMDHCPFCERAKALLKQRGVAFQEIHVDENDDKKWDELYQLSGMRTMPQIWAGDKLIGGFTDLDDLDKKEGLDHLK